MTLKLAETSVVRVNHQSRTALIYLCCLQAARRPTTGSKCITSRKQHNVMECYNIWVSMIFSWFL